MHFDRHSDVAYFADHIIWRRNMKVRWAFVVAVGSTYGAELVPTCQRANVGTFATVLTYSEYEFVGHRSHSYAHVKASHKNTN
jgi:hypothetical protein